MLKRKQSLRNQAIKANGELYQHPYRKDLLYLRVSERYDCLQCFRGGSGKCPIVMPDLVAMYNMVQEAQSKGKQLPENYDFWATRHTLKTAYQKYFNLTNNRLKKVLNVFRIETDSEEFSTKLPVEGIIETFDKKLSFAKQTFATLMVETSWLATHSKEYQDLYAILAPSSCCPSTLEELEAFKKFLYLDMTILLGADVPWTNPDARSSEEQNHSRKPETSAGDGGSGRSTHAAMSQN